MINSSNFTDIKTTDIPKITICAALTLEDGEEMGQNPSTPEQIKNLSKIDWRNQWTVKFYFEGRAKKR